MMHVLESKRVFLAILSLIGLSTTAVAQEAVENDVTSLGAGKPYAIIQLGNDGGTGGNKLEITSNSSVFGSTLKGVDDAGEQNKLSTSKVTGAWDREDGVTNDISSSATGSQNTLNSTDFNQIAEDAVALSAYWAAVGGTVDTVDLNSSTKILNASGGMGTVIDVNGDFILNSDARLTLNGGVGDFFVFNIAAGSKFEVNSDSIIELTGDITASEVLFNVLGNVGGGGEDEAKINSGSIFQGTLLAPGRKVDISSNHFYTFESGDNAPETTAITAADAIFQKTQGEFPDSGGLFGQIVAGDAINFSESDINYQPFMATPVPLPAAVWLLGSALGLIAFKRR